MSIVDKTLWIMERNSGQAMSLPGIAQACGVSRTHLACAFASATGWPVMKYLRARRLSAAAARLAAGEQDILSLALDSGYASHEAFTRAFRDQFGSTPEQVRAGASTEHLALVPALRPQGQPQPTLAPPLLQAAEASRAVGLARRHPLGVGNGIPVQWQDFMARCFEIPNRIDGIPIGIVRGAGDEEGLVSCPVNS